VILVLAQWIASESASRLRNCCAIEEPYALAQCRKNGMKLAQYVHCKIASVGTPYG
jgi:hypothetical protein